MGYVPKDLALPDVICSNHRPFAPAVFRLLSLTGASSVAFGSSVSGGNLVWCPILVRCCSRREGRWSLPLVVIECIAFVLYMCLGSSFLCFLWSSGTLVFLLHLFGGWLYDQGWAPQTRSFSITTSPYRLSVLSTLLTVFECGMVLVNVSEWLK